MAVYIAFTLAVTEWRMDFRLQMNRLESESGRQAVDSLINYETVKYFGNEQQELERFDTALDAWEGSRSKARHPCRF